MVSFQFRNIMILRVKEDAKSMVDNIHLALIGADSHNGVEGVVKNEKNISFSFDFEILTQTSRKFFILRFRHFTF